MFAGTGGGAQGGQFERFETLGVNEGDSADMKKVRYPLRKDFRVVFFRTPCNPLPLELSWCWQDAHCDWMSYDTRVTGPEIGKGYKEQHCVGDFVLRERNEYVKNM